MPDKFISICMSEIEHGLYEPLITDYSSEEELLKDFEHKHFEEHKIFKIVEEVHLKSTIEISIDNDHVSPAPIDSDT